MTRSILIVIFSVMCAYSYGEDTRWRTLDDYIIAAKSNSPLIADYRNRKAIEQSELQRLKSLYTRSSLEVNGEYLFVPIISKDGGHTTFEWNAQSATDYYGYDLGESSGHLHAGVTWTQPLLGGSAYKVARERSEINNAINDNLMRMEEHQLERAVTEQYLLCMLDKVQIEFADTVASLLERQTGIVRRLCDSGMARRADEHLLEIERQSNSESLMAFRQSYHTHLMELNLLCGIDDTTDVQLADIRIVPEPSAIARQSRFAEQFRLDSLSVASSLRSFELQYKPQLNLYVNAGMQTGAFGDWYRHFGWSAGVTFSWTIYDGRQKRDKERQTQIQQNSISTYRDNAEFQRTMRVKQCLSELAAYDERIESHRRQQSEYADVLACYEKEMRAGLVSVLDYITVLRNRIQNERDCMLLETNRQLIMATYNYWNW